jgi:gluconokinase
MVIIVMGVSGSGKTTTGRALAERLGGEFLEGDAYHPQANIAKMRQGIPLTDRDRSTWLARLSQEISRRKCTGGSTPTVVSCSALKRRYRDRLRQADRDLELVFLTGSPALLRARLARRPDHFMPPSLLASQLATLEAPQEDESPIVVDIASRVDEIVAYVSRVLLDRQAARNPSGAADSPTGRGEPAPR